MKEERKRIQRGRNEKLQKKNEGKKRMKAEKEAMERER